uniref:NADH-ubiquinone oxidoreductase chain 2 n=1 Tax=Sphaerotheriidae sp. HYS-2012 TaxID=1170231 RepID=I6PDL4_9MYRI|nr:NADH dehydrogenase subunit 2 [Sphaerotheriidae sp. HYS-2012]AFH54824.1 NADH dehydrogenase subunit 2 [Sphaerotheriidae sp. HYS-2012]
MELFKKKVFILLLFTGTFITVSSSSWFSAWLGLEMNLIAFIPMIFDNNQISSEASFKYFLIQVAGSIVFIISSIIMSMNFNFISLINSKNIMMLIILMTLLLKMGASPFHFWFPNLIDGLSWINSLLLMTWQKLAPLSLLSFIIFNFKILMILSVWPSLVSGALGGFNQTSLKKILTYSSIAHMGWMIASIYFSVKLFMIYFFLYCMLLFILLLSFLLMNVSSLTQLFMNDSLSSLSYWLLMINLLSLGGLPPFLGFFPKWLVFTLMVKFSIFTSITMIISSLVILFFYLRLAIQGLMIITTSHKYPSYFMVNFMPNHLSLFSLTFFLLIPIM